MCNQQILTVTAHRLGHQTNAHTLAAAVFTTCGGDGERVIGGGTQPTASIDGADLQLRTTAVANQQLLLV